MKITMGEPIIESVGQSMIEQDTAVRLLSVVSFVWVGLVVGISFLAAPVKFAAPSVTRVIGLDVGRHVFLALNRLELGVAVVGLGLLVFGRPSDAQWSLATAVGGILLIQTVWLLPVLRVQAARIIAGEIEHASEYVHLGYVGLESLKCVCLLTLDWQVFP